MKNIPKNTPKIKIIKNGPYLVSGDLPMAKQIIVSDSKGVSVRWKEGKHYLRKEKYLLCRCGHSHSKPYCDETHKEIGFDGTETASQKKYLKQAETIDGRNLKLTDAVELCASARFCNRAGGVWKLTKESDNPKSKKIAIQEACDCPAGRLVAWNKKTRKAIEPKLKLSIGLVEDPENKVSGPIWARGGIPIESAGGTQYEVRNRATLCCCGKSKNKPFCDGAHISAGFSDEK